MSTSKHSEYYRSFISKVSFFQEIQESNLVKVWVEKPPKWLPYGQPLNLTTTEFKADTLKGMYYFPGKLQFFVEPFTFDVHEIRYVMNTDTKCIIL